MLKKAKFLSLGFLLAFTTSAYASSDSISRSLPDEMNNKAAVEKEMSIKDQLKRQAETQLKSEELKISNRIKLHSTRVRQSLGKQNASRPLMQKGRETFGHTLGVYLGARMDA